MNKTFQKIEQKLVKQSMLLHNKKGAEKGKSKGKEVQSSVSSGFEPSGKEKVENDMSEDSWSFWSSENFLAKLLDDKVPDVKVLKEECQNCFGSKADLKESKPPCSFPPVKNSFLTSLGLKPNEKAKTELKNSTFNEPKVEINSTGKRSTDEKFISKKKDKVFEALKDFKDFTTTMLEKRAAQVSAKRRIAKAFAKTYPKVSCQTLFDSDPLDYGLPSQSGGQSRTCSSDSVEKDLVVGKAGQKRKRKSKKMIKIIQKRKQQKMKDKKETKKGKKKIRRKFRMTLTKRLKKKMKISKKETERDEKRETQILKVKTPVKFKKKKESKGWKKGQELIVIDSSSGSDTGSVKDKPGGTSPLNYAPLLDDLPCTLTDDEENVNCNIDEEKSDPQQTRTVTSITVVKIQKIQIVKMTKIIKISNIKSDSKYLKFQDFENTPKSVLSTLTGNV